MTDTPGSAFITSKSRFGGVHSTLKTIRQYFAAQVICEKNDGAEIALTDQGLWGHEYDIGGSPAHRWFPKDKMSIKAYDCKDGKTPNSAPSTIPTTGGSIPAGPPRPPTPTPPTFTWPPTNGWIPLGY